MERTVEFLEQKLVERVFWFIERERLADTAMLRETPKQIGHTIQISQRNLPFGRLTFRSEIFFYWSEKLLKKRYLYAYTRVLPIKG